jgi:hypothetical protein
MIALLASALLCIHSAPDSARIASDTGRPVTAKAVRQAPPQAASSPEQLANRSVDAQELQALSASQSAKSQRSIAESQKIISYSSAAMAGIAAFWTVIALAMIASN